MRHLLINMLLLVPAAAFAQAPCQPADQTTRCQLEQIQKSSEEYRARMQKNLEDLQRQRAEQEARDRKRKAECVAQMDKLNKDAGQQYTREQLCGF